jgi:hypothetical protein
VGWVWGRQTAADEQTDHGALKNTVVVNGFFFIMRFVTPVLVM